MRTRPDEPPDPTSDPDDDAWLDPSLHSGQARDDSDDEWLETEFPLGDGVAETGGVVVCPYCGEANDVALDPGSGARQDYVEDCQVCCQPWRVVVAYHDDGSVDVIAVPADGR
jgi:hypothetical protein